MEDPNSDEGLPPGWQVEVKVRKNGKRSDKYYISPSSGLKFNSKAEVLRHLESANKVSIQRISENVVVEKRPAEGLPPGWIKKTRITNKGDKIRRDPFYIDPVSGYTFRSIKDVDRYLASGKIGRNAFKSKDNDKAIMVLKDEKFSARMPKKENINLPRRSSKRLAGIKADPILEHKTRNQVHRSPVKQPGEEETTTDGDKSTNSFPNCLEKRFKSLEEVSEIKCKSDNTENTIELLKLTTPEKHPVKKAKQFKSLEEGSEIKYKSDNTDNTIELPKLTTPEKHRVKKAEQFKSLEEGSEIKCKSDNTDDTIELPKLTTPEKHPVKNLEVHRSDKDQECLSILSVPENGDKVDAKLGSNPDFPLKEILSDPCIAFAIQTLTGTTCEAFKDPLISSELKKSQHSETSGASAERHGKKINVPGEVSPKLPSPEGFAVTQEHAGVAKNDHKTKENAGSACEKTLDTSLMDPCIEFAIKTLTATIPVDCDQNPKNYIQQQLSSSNTQKPKFKQSFVDPTLQHTRNIVIGNSAGARHTRFRKNRRNVC
ncbi:methyl-CpG-binding domain-containing protein 13-like [Lotus japonicus]|uniref:methyl-CpG-binding domain-containing protein 13-like n=1 Tax=Lotus japonicus TaxID=34305 RepID=UPI002590865E|nr:methyl-CpG-binding domain-containing protein 13-like [Lotus japonicus]